MLESLKALFSELAGGGRREPFAEDDYRLAAAGLLVHALVIDGDMSVAERRKLHDVLQSRFDLDEAATAQLIADATAAEGEAVDLYHFTRLLNRTLDEEGRKRIIEMMWEMIYADGRVDELEDNLVWRTADLLGVSGRDRLNLRRRVASDNAIDPRKLKQA